MGDSLEQAQSLEDQDQLGQQEVVTPPEDEGGGNPNWEALRSKLDPTTFKLIEDDLKAADDNARKRIESVNKAYEPFKKFADQQVTPETLEAGLNLFGQIQNQPEEVHKVLTDFLRENGRLPETPAEVKQVVEEAQAEQDEDGQPAAPAPTSDPRLDRAMSYIEQQEQRELQDTADKHLEQEIAAVKEAHKDWSDKDIAQATRYTLAGLASDPSYTLARGAKDWEDARRDLLTTPRPGNSAPDLVSPSAGIPAGQQTTTSIGQQSKEEVIDLVADLLNKTNAKS